MTSNSAAAIYALRIRLEATATQRGSIPSSGSFAMQAKEV